MAILPPSTDSRRVVVSFKRKYVHKVLVKHLVKLAQEKSVVRWTDHPHPALTIAAVWGVKHCTKQTMVRYIVSPLSVRLKWIFHSLIGPGQGIMRTRKLFSYFSTKTYVVGTQKNRFNETVLLSTQNIFLKLWVRKYLQFYTENVCLFKPMFHTDTFLVVTFPFPLWLLKYFYLYPKTNT